MSVLLAFHRIGTILFLDGWIFFGFGYALVFHGTWTSTASTSDTNVE